ncbi:sensor histidine kinase [Flavobacterium sp. FlaQc-57]|uniref:ATP-binding protein n=1 Tax=Flavobacterium sp. FlaQc-57 TaxID=3374186 RepID=UPI003757BF00
MIQKLISFFQNKTVLKYFLAILLFLILGISLYLIKCTKNEIQINKKDNTAQIKKLLDKADILFDTYRFENSYYYFNEAQLLCDTRTDYVDYVYALTCMASVEQSLGDFTASEILLTKTLPHLKKIKKPRFAANVYGQFGANYYYTYDYNNSLFYYTKALHLKTSNYRKIAVLNSICLIYIKQKKYKLAESILIPISKIKTICKNDITLNDNEYSRILDNIGICYREQGKPEALDYYKRSLAIKLRLKEYNGLLYNYLHLAEYFQNTNQPLANTYAKKAYVFSNKLNDASNKLQSLKLLTKTSKGNDVKKYSLKFIQLADSITTLKKKSKKQFARIKYYSKQDRSENLQLKDEKTANELHLERQKKRNIISYIIIVFTTLLSLFLYLHLKLKSRKEKNEEILKSEMRISKKLHDELANDLYQTRAFAQTKDLEENENKEYLLNNLDALYSKTRNISKENSLITTNELYHIGLKEMISGFKTPDINILLNGLNVISWDQIDKNKKIILYRVLQELFFNMKKHSNATLVSITFKIINKNIAVNYTDNGTREKNNPIIFKNGLQNVESRIKTINGTIIFDNESHSSFKLSFTFPL